MKLRHILLLITTSSLCAWATVFVYTKLSGPQQTIISSSGTAPVSYAKYFDGNSQSAAAAVDFTKAASLAVSAVVHIKTKTPAKKIANDNKGFDNLLRDFFGSEFEPSFRPEQRATGSGVLISDDGYIITGNHVIADDRGNIASEITVTLNNHKTYKANVIGRDAATDIAVLKIQAGQLPHLVFGNSNDIQTGQWVLAVGYPFSLEATVTAGIISATGRSIGTTTRQVRNGETPARSFIQTDAAVNTGNSGGALVNTAGELIGINSGIISPTGTYAGYSFAVPVNTVKKAVKEIIQSSGMLPKGG